VPSRRRTWPGSKRERGTSLPRELRKRPARLGKRKPEPADKKFGGHLKKAGSRPVRIKPGSPNGKGSSIFDKLPPNNSRDHRFRSSIPSHSTMNRHHALVKTFLFQQDVENIDCPMIYTCHFSDTLLTLKMLWEKAATAIFEKDHFTNEIDRRKMSAVGGSPERAGPMS